MERAIFDAIFSLSRHSGFLDGVIYFSAVYLPFIVLVALLLLIVRSAREWRGRFIVFSAAAFAAIIGRGFIVEAIQFFYYHPRPFLELGLSPLLARTTSNLNSFPSAHATLLFGAAVVAYYFNRNWSGWFFAAALLNGIARVAAGVHWPLDILGGAMVGIMSGIIGFRMVEPYLKKLGSGFREK